MTRPRRSPSPETRPASRWAPSRWARPSGRSKLTVAHLLTRVQFGQPIGAFQALQHRAADLHVLVESARSLSRAMAAEAGCDPSLGLRAAAVKVYCSETLTAAASEMIQLHGAIGVTWEHRAHRYLKRAHGGRHLFGSPARHLSAIAANLIERRTGGCY